MKNKLILLLSLLLSPTISCMDQDNIHEDNPDSDVSDTETSTSFNGIFQAVRAGNIDRVRQIISIHPTFVNAPGDDEDEFTTPLHVAAETGNLEMAQLLLDHGALIDAEDWQCSTPLFNACSNGNSSMVKFLLKKGARATFISTTHYTPLHFAAMDGHTEVARILLDHGAQVNLNVINDDEETPLHAAAIRNYPEIVQLFLDRGAHIDERSENGLTPLHMVKDREMATFLLEHGANVNARDNKGRTPLHTAIDFVDQKLNTNVAEVLLENRALVNAQDNDGQTALHCAMQPDSPDNQDDLINCILLLLQHGADLNTRDNKGITPLHMAMQNKHLEVVQLLNNWPYYKRYRKRQLLAFLSTTKFQETPKLIDILYEDIVKRFKKAHSHDTIEEINKLAIEGKKIALQDAASTGDILKVIELIVKNPELAPACLGQYTPLHTAARNGHIEIVQFLLQSEADLNALDSNKKTPYQLAVENNHTDIAQLLVDWPFYKRYQDMDNWVASTFRSHSNDSNITSSTLIHSIKHIHELAEKQREFEESCDLNFDEPPFKKQKTE